MSRTLTPAVRKLYVEWLRQNSFRSRASQIEMMNFIESIVAQNPARIGVVEAATGTGKTLAYAATAIPLARELNKKVVIATATVTLQEQIVQKDLPSLRKACDVGFTFCLAKGRQRYVCPLRLEQIVQPNISTSLIEKLDEQTANDRQPIKKYERLFDAFQSMKWDGDRDNAPAKLSEEQWLPIITDSRGCMGRNCSSFSQCPYFLTRQQIRASDVVVTNYDHLLRSIQRDSETYPPLRDIVLICDEAHHLSSKVMSVFSSRIALNDSNAMLNSLHGSLDRLGRMMVQEPAINPLIVAFSESYLGLLAKLDELKEYLKDCFRGEKDNVTDYRFAFGNPTNAIREVATHLAVFYDELASTVGRLSSELKKIVETQESKKSPQGLIEYVNELGSATNHLNEATTLFGAYSVNEDQSVCARWISRSLDELRPEWVLHNVPIAVEKIVNPLLWNEAHAAICTSATLNAGDDFGHFIEAAGLKKQSPATLQLESPFNLVETVSLYIPTMQTLLTAQDRTRLAHTNEVVQMLPKVLMKHQSALVLFAAKRTMREVYDQLPQSMQELCFLQEGTGIPVLLKEHRDRIDRGDRSYLFGVASLREGIDLPGVYCRHVVITKLPFDVPGDPIMESRRELLLDQGVEIRELFSLVQLPPVILKLKQACGRLIRNEADFGQITILDVRLVKRPYGSQILSSLPDYKIITRYRSRSALRNP